MKDMIKISSRLGIICAVAAVVLALVNSITAPEIAAYQERVVAQALEQVSTGYEVGETLVSDKDGISSVTELLKSGSAAGYVMNITTSGYGGPMDLLASFTADGEVIAAKLLTNAETPGLGKKAESDEYMEKFVGTGGSSAVPQRKSDLPEAQADSVSGATITFSGVAKGLALGSEYAVELGGAN